MASLSREQAIHTLDQHMRDVRSRTLPEDARKRAARLVKELATIAKNDMPTEQFQSFFTVLNQRTMALIQSTEPADRIGGVMILDQLVDFDGIEPALKYSRFQQLLSTILRGKDITIMHAAASVLGKLCKPGGSLISELVDAEVQTALEWLQSDRVEERRYAAVLVLRELARNAPTLMYGYMTFIFEQIWIGLRDPRLLIRSTSSEAVSACFKIIRERDQNMKQEWMDKIWDETVRGLKMGTVDTTHASLLVLKEMLEQGGMYMQDHYQEACEIVFRYKDSREGCIRKTVVLLIPDLANYAPNDFASTYLHKFMVFLSGMLKKEKDRNDAFYAIGNIANSVKSAIAPYLDGVLIYVREGLSLQARKRGTVDPVFDCISRLAVAVGQTLSKYMEALLDPIFACELTPKLTQALVDMAFYIPPVKATIQERLLDMLSKVLCGEPFRPLGAPNPNTLSAIPVIPKDPKDPLAHERSKNEIKLALNTLGSFDFSGHVLNEFVRDVAIKYVEDDDPEIREAAALTCCQLYVRDPIVNQTSYHALQVVGDVVEKLLTVGVSDPVPAIRSTVLRALGDRFDTHLAKAENIRTLFFALHDEMFENREAAVRIIGRLTAHNPAYVVPQLRKTIIQLLTELEYTDVSRSKEEAAKLLGLLTEHAKDLVRPYVNSILEVLMPKALDTNPGVAGTVLQALGQLCVVGGEDMLAHKDKLMPIIIGALKDQSSNSKRVSALLALGQLASNAGYVIEPYKEHPELLEILQGIVRGEPQGTLRQDTIKLMGILGALDPYKYQQIEEKAGVAQRRPEATQLTDVSLMMNGLTPSQEDYYPTVVINALLGILKDQSLLQWHGNVVDAIMSIFITLGLKCVQFLDRVVPSFISVIRASPAPRLDFYFNHFSRLVGIVRQHIRVYLPEIIDLLQEYWNVSNNLQTTIMNLIESIARSLEGEFKIYLASLLPMMLSVLDKDVSTKRQPSEKIFHALLVFGSSGEEYMHLIIPVLVRLYDTPAQPTFLRKSAIETVGKLSSMVNLNDYAAKIIHPLVRILHSNEPSLRVAALDTLCALMLQLGRDYLHFEHTVGKAIAQHSIQHANYEKAVDKLKKGEVLSQNLAPRFEDNVTDLHAPESNPPKKLDLNPMHLKQAWETKGKSTKDDWHEWFRKFSTTLLTESPNHSLRACASLASNYQPLAKDLFNSAFVSCWSELYEQFQEELITNIENTIKSENVPPDLLGQLLNLAEFMEHDDKALPIDIRVLGREAARCHAYAKALHYKELEFLQDHNSHAVEALIVINNQLQQADAAIGILRKVKAYKDGIQLRESWFEKLERWDEALNFYIQRENEVPDDQATPVDILMGKMRCYHALGEWDSLARLAGEVWRNAGTEVQKRIAPLATTAAWGLGKWDSMESYLQSMKRNSPDKSFFGAILSLHRNQFDVARNCIQLAREGLDTELSALVSESYSRAYQVVVRVQMLAELEELIVYKQANPEKKATLRKTWETRLKGCSPNVEVWQRMLRLRSLVMTPHENMHMWTKFANLCRKNKRMTLAEKSLKQLIGTDQPLESVIPYWHDRQASPAPNRIASPILYAVLKFQWQIGQEPGVRNSERRVAEKTLYCLRKFTNETAHRIESSRMQLNAHAANGMVDGAHHSGFPDFDEASLLNPHAQRHWQEQTVLLAKCYLRQGEWMIALNKDDWQYTQRQDILNCYLKATQYNTKWYKAWHAWALANFEVVQALSSRAGQDDRIEQGMVQQHVVPAVRGFFESIALSSGSSLQDTLRLLTLWLTYGGNPDVNASVTEGFSRVSIDTWLEVIPQLIARINQPNRRVQQSIHNLLADVGRAHPQALVYPLTVAMKSRHNARRSRSATQIMDSMRQHSARLVEQAEIVSHELIRVAVLWHELWHEALEEASRLWFGNDDLDGMFATLEPLHNLLERGPETLREVSFAQTFGRDLNEAREWCRQYRETQDKTDLGTAWDLYYTVFKRIARQLPQITSLDLQYCSPNLLAAKDLQLAVPGTYKSGQEVVRIMSFDTMFSVISSKQRPRKLDIVGSDGKTYTFLLKGHEDIRQDERVMQLFGLCNTLLGNDSECYKRHLNIQRYPAIPLSQNSGLLGWVPNSDTVHQLIREYRESRKILLNIEHRIMLQMAPDYDNLTLMQKVEVFGYALDNTTGQDLYRVLWLKSKSSEAWLDRRTNYTRSLGVMSMVGYILGLGDRHPSNLMLDRITGKIIHIDFGDCFEVAMKREKYPERVPFRLTRMLTYAMEVSNIEGSFRTTCEHVMRVLRDNKESVMAVLEAFIHDPLLTWRLTNPASPPGPHFNSEREQAIAGAQVTGRARRPSILEGPLPPTEFLAAQANGNDVMPGVPPGARARARTNSSAPPPGTSVNGVPPPEAAEAQNERAVEVLARVSQKLTGRDFKPEEELIVNDQVNKLIIEATKLENLCQHYIGWCSFW